MEIIIYLQTFGIYFLIGLVYLLIESFVLGYLGQNLNDVDFLNLIIWPVAIMHLLGLLIRMLTNKLKVK